MRLRRDFTAARVNRVVNHPEVLPYMGGIPGQAIDLAPLVADQRNYLLMTDLGGFLFQWTEFGVYHLHTMFLPAGRGKHALICAHEAAELMFTHTECMEILTVSPRDNARAKPPLHMGFTHEFSRDGCFTTGAEFYALRYYEWVKRAHGLDKAGRWFHKRLEAQRHKLNIATPAHADDAAHDRYVGAAVKTIQAGQVEKALTLYNRWAIFAGYAPMQIHMLNPIIISVGDGFIQLTDDLKDFEVIPCQSQPQ